MLFTARSLLYLRCAASSLTAWPPVTGYRMFAVFNPQFAFIIKYLQILVDLVFRRRKYSFESIEKMGGN